MFSKTILTFNKKIFKTGEHEGKGHVCHNSCVPWHPVLWPVSHAKEKKQEI